MTKHFLPNGDAVEYIDGPYREYTIYRIYDERVDPKPKMGEIFPPIYKFTANPTIHDEIARIGELQRLDVWILDANLEWHKKNPLYWRKIFKLAELQTFMPGLRVFEPKWDGTIQQGRDEVSQYWKRLCWSKLLPIGEVDIWDAQISGFPEFKAKAYQGPRTSTRWIKALRFWIRMEHHVVSSGTRRTLDDYPPKVKKGLSIAIELMTKDLDFVDNIRFAQTRKPGEMRRFRRAEANGCCGKAERYVIIGTQQYIIGCNYGH